MADRWGQFEDAGTATNKWGQFQDAPRVEEDIGRSLAVGLRKGVVSVPGIPGSLEQLGRMVIDWVSQKGGLGNPELSQSQVLPTAADYQRGDQLDVGPYYTPRTTAGRYAETIGEFAPNLVSPGGVVRRVLHNTMAPAVASEAAGQATEGTAYEPTARVAGAVLGPAAPSLAMRAATPFPATAAHQRHIQVLDDEGVSMTAGTRSGSRPLRTVESVARDTPLSAGPARAAFDQEAADFTRAVLRRIGEQGDEATGQVLQRARQRIGAEFERLSHIDMDFNVSPQGARARQDLSRAVQAAEIRYENTVLRPEYRSAVQHVVDQLNDEMLSGRITGRQVQHWRSRLGEFTNAADDPAAQQFFGAVQRALDDAREAMLSGADRAAWRAARDQWGHLKVLQHAMEGAGEAVASGQVTPARLRMASNAANDLGYVEETGRYADLARAGVGAMTPLPNSGTPMRQGVMHLATTATGVAAGAATGGLGAAAGAAGGALAPGLVLRGLMHPWAQGYLGNQALAGPINAVRDPRRPTERLLSQAPTAPAQATDPDIPSVQRFEEALKLKKGTRFIDPHGVERVR